MNKFEKALSKSKPMKGQMNDWQYVNLKNLIPKDLSAKEHEKHIKRICEKIKI